MFGLTNLQVSAIQSVFKKYPVVHKAIIYGSRAKGNYKNGSDIDLTLIGNHLDLTTLMKIENELDDLLLPYKIDLSIFYKINNPCLIEHIERIGEVFYEKKIIQHNLIEHTCKVTASPLHTSFEMKEFYC